MEILSNNSTYHMKSDDAAGQVNYETFVKSEKSNVT